MNPRERVIKSINHEEPDRVPIAMGGTAQKFDEPVILELLDYFGIPQTKLEYVFASFRFTYFCEDLWQKLGVDTRYVYVNPEKYFTIDIQKQGKKYINEWGLDLDFGRGAFSDSLTLRQAPLREANLKDVEKYKWPKPDPIKLTQGLRKKAKSFLEKGYPVIAYRPVVAGIFSISRFLRGTEQFFMDMILNKDFAITLLDKVTQVQKLYYDALINAVGDYIQVVEIEDDLGTQQAPMISPKLYNELIKPKHAELIRFIKKKQPKIKVMIHSDGSIAKLIPGFIEAGVDIVNPIQTSAKDMDLKYLKREFGDKIVFQGGIDTQRILRGRTKEVEEEVKRVVDILAPGGGYLFGPSQNLTRDIPKENII
ncbi:hypothetical protein J7M02_03330, partial [Candidatus Aerophobetes bacterium]|nr:hypothetical protein [Candidatus Aerophobetes bacterium]